MPWITNRLEILIEKALELINPIYNIQSLCPIFLCDQHEMILRVSEEISKLGLSDKKKELIREYVLRDVIGKYFKETHEIWLVEGRGDNLADLIHEILHSIQKCNPNREGIVEYLTFKLTNDTSAITEENLANWNEIEKQVRLKTIFERLTKDGNCEDF